LIRRSSKILLEVIGVAVAVTATLLAVLAWQLSSGPVSLSLLNQMIEDAANPALQGGELDIEDTVLIWSAEDRELSLRLRDVRLVGADGNQVARVPQLAFDLSMPALLRGTLAPKAIDLFGVRATVLRRPGTGVTLALAKTDAEAPDLETPAVVGPMLEALVSEGDLSSPLGYLSRLGIRDARLRFVDEVNGVTFDAPDASVVIFKGGGGLAGVLHATFAIGDTMATLDMNGVLPAGADEANIEASIADLVPAALARTAPSLSDYAVFDAPLFATGELRIGRDGALRSGRLSLRAGSGNINLPAPWETVIPLEAAEGDVTIDGLLQRIKLEKLVVKAGQHEASLGGTVDYRTVKGLDISSARVDLAVDRFHTEVPGFFAGPVDLEKATLKADIDFDALKADIEELFIGSGGGGIRLSGSLADAERSPAVKVKGTLEPMPLEALKAIWPVPVAKGAREWVGKNLSGGNVDSGSFDIDLAGGMIQDAADHIPLPKDALRLEFATSGQTMHYLGELPPMDGLQARGLVHGNRFDAWISSAVIRQENMGDVTISEGHFYDDELSRKGALGHIVFKAAGATSDVLSVLDNEPLHFVGDFGIDPSTVGGTGTLEANISLPLIKSVQMEQVDFSGKAHIENASIPKIRENLSLTGGTLDLTVSRTSLTAKGLVVLNEAARVDLEWKEDFRRDVTPGSVYRLRGEVDDAARSAVGLELGQFVSGPVQVDATIMGNGRNVDRASVKADLTAAVAKLDDAAWRKEPGVAATTGFDVFLQEDGGYRLSNFSLSGEGIAVEGTFTVGNGGRLVAANFPSVRLGPDNDFSFTAGPAENAALEMVLRGPRFDARGVLGSLFSGSGDEKPEQDRAEDVPLLEDVPVADPLRRTAVRADIGTAIGNHGTSFNDVRVDMVQIDGDLWSMDVSATPLGGDTLSLKVGPDEKGARRLRMVSSDAGTVFRALDFTRSIRGGKLNVVGVYDDGTVGSPLRGTLTVDDFRIVDAPVLANILTLGSLTGIGDTLRGDGILFVGLEMPFVMTKNRIHLKDGRMSGPAIGLTMDGQIDRATDRIDMEGTLVPAYTINSFLGKVPLLGPLIVGREGEGIFAITYSVRGQADDPSVVVNPLSAIAPGFLRRIFEFGESMPPESQTPDKSQENSVPAAEAPAASEPAAAPAAPEAPKAPEANAAGAPAAQKN